MAVPPSVSSSVLRRPVADGGSVADAMVRWPVLHPPSTSVGEARAALDDPHRHLVLVVSGRRLLGTLERADLACPYADDEPALRAGRLDGRTAGPGEPLQDVLATMAASGERRRAVVDAAGDLLGLLCLKASGTGWCTDAGIAARAALR